MPTLIEEGLSLPTKENSILGSWQKREISSCYIDAKKYLEQPLKDAVANTFPFEPLYELIKKHIPSFESKNMNENVAIDHFVLNFGCTDALEEIKEREYEPHAKMDAKNTFSFIECIQDFYNKIFNQEQNAVSDMIKTDPKK
jgi:hypothetical protein